MTNEWLRDIEVGDEVVFSGGGPMNKPGVDKVQRLTKTQIILEGSGTRYRRSDGRQIGVHSWHTRYLRPADAEKLKEIKNDQDKRIAVGYLTKLNWKNLSLESLNSVVEVVKNL